MNPAGGGNHPTYKFLIVKVVEIVEVVQVVETVQAVESVEVVKAVQIIVLNPQFEILSSVLCHLSSFLVSPVSL
jgi:hypothetical protein